MKNDRLRFCCFLRAVLLSYILLRITLVDYYTIATSSMSPPIQPGQRVRAIKPLFYGRQKIIPSDIIIFNVPKHERIWEIVRGEVYCKRVLGCPGDRIGAVDGHCWNDKVLRPVGVVEEQEKLRWMFDGFFRMADSFDVIPYTGCDWNVKNWGPMTVPAKGLTMILDSLNRELYRQVIESETGAILEDSVMEYTFKEDYYFVVGDNAISSSDSRYWGFVPEEFILGIVCDRSVR